MRKRFRGPSSEIGEQRKPCTSRLLLSGLLLLLSAVSGLNFVHLSSSSTNAIEKEYATAPRVTGKVPSSVFENRRVEANDMSFRTHENRVPISLEKGTTPAFVVGFPKSGTTSVYRFFNCSGITTQHYCSGGDTKDFPPCDSGPMAVCILKNMAKKLPMLEGCGDYQVYTQIDGERPIRGPAGNKGCLMENGRLDKEYKMRHFLPQHFHLDKLHAYAPNATFILPLRDPSDWASSVSNWFFMRRLILMEYKYFNRTMEIPRNPKKKHHLLERLYREHTEYVREFVRRRPSHTLIEVDIASVDAGRVMAEAFGLHESCWGHHNRKENHDRLANFTGVVVWQPKPGR